MKLVFLGVFLFSINLVFSQNTNLIHSSAPDTLVVAKVDLGACVDEKDWVVHLTNELEPAIKKAAKKGLKAGTYIVRVKFLVERDGSIKYVQALNDPGYNLAKAAVKGVQTGPRWSPGIQNGRKVRSFHTQPICFVIQEGNG
ncbi:MAG TPA: energy transducer TonB [Flavisolibacter sp.]|nr:energy transducer TonB [Flavisolibacter sp.]